MQQSLLIIVWRCFSLHIRGPLHPILYIEYVAAGTACPVSRSKDILLIYFKSPLIPQNNPAFERNYWNPLYSF